MLTEGLRGPWPALDLSLPCSRHTAARPRRPLAVPSHTHSNTNNNQTQGLLDDLLLLPALLWAAVKLIPPEIMADARARARAEPLLLRRNWLAATLVFALWTALLAGAALWAFDRWVADDETRPYGWAVAAGTAGVCSIAFATWLVTRVQHERRRRDEWNAALNAPLLAGAGGSGGGSGGSGGGGGGGGRGEDAA